MKAFRPRCRCSTSSSSSWFHSVVWVGGVFLVPRLSFLILFLLSKLFCISFMFALCVRLKRLLKTNKGGCYYDEFCPWRSTNSQRLAETGWESVSSKTKSTDSQNLFERVSYCCYFRFKRGYFIFYGKSDGISISKFHPNWVFDLWGEFNSFYLVKSACFGCEAAERRTRGQRKHSKQNHLRKLYNF